MFSSTIRLTIAIVTICAVSDAVTELSDVPGLQTDLGTIRPVTDLKIKNAFFRRNKHLGPKEEDVSVTGSTDGFAFISVLPGDKNYVGFVKVTFNGYREPPSSKPPTTPVRSGGKFQLQLQNFKADLGNLGRNPSDDVIKRAFMEVNNPQSDLESALGVKNKKQNSAELYVKNPSSAWAGAFNVRFTSR